jgi:calcineurin-like phosphoesterase family protein
MNKLYYISDWHYNHANIIAFDNRPFLTVDEMNNELIRRWNDTVDDQDQIYILGDFIWGGEKMWIDVLHQLKGRKHLIRGNHDLDPCYSRKLFVSVQERKEIVDGGRHLVLDHFPTPYFKNHFHGWIHLYGHVHQSFEWNMVEHDKHLMENLYCKPCEMYNVGAMMSYMDYTPRTLDEIIAGYNKMRKENGEEKETN